MAIERERERKTKKKKYKRNREGCVCVHQGCVCVHLQISFALTMLMNSVVVLLLCSWEGVDVWGKETLPNSFLLGREVGIGDHGFNGVVMHRIILSPLHPPVRENRLKRHFLRGKGALSPRKCLFKRKC